MVSLTNLFGEEIVEESPSLSLKEIVSKANNKTKRKSKKKESNIEDQMANIKKEVYAILGRYVEDTYVIKTREELKKYIDKALENGIIAVDTETLSTREDIKDGALDYLTCKICGLCLYTPGLKQAYIPMNHIDKYTRERLSWQLNEKDIKELVEPIKDIKIVYHNAKFDIEVLHCTCDLDLPVYWDTQIASFLFDENEDHTLKYQYKAHVDASAEKYNIEQLFEGLEYSIFEPELFALYSATDPFITYKLYEYQLKQMQLDENKKIYKLFTEVEIPIILVCVRMELLGACLDLDYCKRVRVKYDGLLEEAEKELSKEFYNYKTEINNWRNSKEANEPTKSYPNKKQMEKLSKPDTEVSPEIKNEILSKFPLRDEEGKPYKIGGTKNSQLGDPISVSSPTQLAIFLYDILKLNPVDKKKPRGTGKEQLEKLAEENDLPICDKLVEYKAFEKLVTSFVDVLPDMLSTRDGRLHGSFNQCGTATGRFSSSKPNLQQVPAKNKEIRLMFKATEEDNEIESDDNTFNVLSTDYVEVSDNNWVKAKNLNVGDFIFEDRIKDIVKEGEYCKITL